MQSDKISSQFIIIISRFAIGMNVCLLAFWPVFIGCTVCCCGYDAISMLIKIIAFAATGGIVWINVPVFVENIKSEKQQLRYMTNTNTKKL